MSLVAGDFNGDGWQDLIVGVYDANGQPRFLVFYIPGVGEGHFASPSLAAESPVLEGTVQGVEVPALLATLITTDIWMQ